MPRANYMRSLCLPDWRTARVWKGQVLFFLTLVRYKPKLQPWGERVSGLWRSKTAQVLKLSCGCSDFTMKSLWLFHACKKKKTSRQHLFYGLSRLFLIRWPFYHVHLLYGWHDVAAGSIVTSASGHMVVSWAQVTVCIPWVYVGYHQVLCFPTAS